MARASMRASLLQHAGPRALLLETDILLDEDGEPSFFRSIDTYSLAIHLVNRNFLCRESPKVSRQKPKCKCFCSLSKLSLFF